MKPQVLKFIIGLCAIYLSVNNNLAQDFQFYQYQNTLLKINPGLLSSEEDFKVSLLYNRTDIGKDLDMKNINISIIYPFNLLRNESLPQGIGVSFYNSNIGNNGLVSLTRANIAFSQGVRVSSWGILSAGLQATYHLFNTNNTMNYTTGNQWVTGYGFDESISIDENIQYEKFNLFTVSSGVNMMFNKGKLTSGHLGFSIFNINNPIYSFLESDNKLDTKYVIHGDYMVFSRNHISLTPRFIYANQSLEIMSIGAILSYSYENKNPFLLIKTCDFNLGLDYRHDHSAIVNFSIQQPRYDIGISYAFNVNNKTTYKEARNNIEVGLVFKFSKSDKKTEKVTEYKLGETKLIFNKGIDTTKKEVQKDNQVYVDNNNSDNIVVTGENYNIQLKEDFKFKFNDATLNEDAMKYLDDLAIMLKQNPELNIEVVGHTDDVGTEEANIIISEKRAKVVVEYLESVGIQKSRLKYTAKGMSEPIVPNNNEENRSKNRRVEFIIYNSKNH